MSTKLEGILAETRQRVAEGKSLRPQRELELAAAKVKTQPRSFRNALLAAAKSGAAVIAELKRASPSRGMIRGSYPVGGLAMQLERSGAAALSVLTEEQHFHGSLSHLLEASAATRLPCLRKDFMVDEYQLYESRLHSADAVLLIAAALDDATFAALHGRARELGLDALCEVHDEAELARAVAIGADIIGVNCRDLRTLQVDPSVHTRLAEKLPRSAVRVAESGFQSGADIRKLRAAAPEATGYQAFLVGESLMRADEPGTALAQLLAESKG